MAGATNDKAKRARLLSTVLYAISAALIVVVVVLYFRNKDQKSIVQPTPPSVPGQYQLINVEQSLQHQGLTVKAAAGGARADAFTPPGQVLDVNGKTLYVFVYGNPADRTADSDGLDPTTLTVTTLAGTPIPPQQLKVFSQSNLIAVLIGGDDSLAAKVDAGMKALP